MTELKPVQVVNPSTGYGETKSVEVGLSPGQTSGTVGGITVNRPAGTDVSKPYYPNQSADKQPTSQPSQISAPSGTTNTPPFEVKPFLDTHPLNPPSQTVQMGMVPDFGFASNLPKPAPVSGSEQKAFSVSKVPEKTTKDYYGIEHITGFGGSGTLEIVPYKEGAEIKSFFGNVKVEPGKEYIEPFIGKASYVGELHVNLSDVKATVNPLDIKLQQASNLLLFSPVFASRAAPLSEGVFVKGNTFSESGVKFTPITELKELTGFKQETSIYTPKGEPPTIESKIEPQLKTSYEIKPSDVTKEIKGTYPVEFKGSTESGGLETFSGKGMFEYRGKEPVITIGTKGNEPVITSEMQDIGKLTPSEIKYDFYTKWGDSELTQSKINMKILKTYQEPTSGLENLAKDTSATTFPSRFPKMVKQPQMAQLEYEQIPNREIFPNAPSVQGLPERVIVSSREIPITATGYYPVLSIPNVYKVTPTFDIKTGITDITKPVTGLTYKPQQEIRTPTTPFTAIIPEIGTTEIITPRIITPQLTPQLTKMDTQTATEFDFNFRPNKPFYPQIPIPGLGGGGGPEKKRWFKYFRTFRASPIAAPSVTMSDVGKTMAKEMSKGMSVEYKKSRKRKK